VRQSPARDSRPSLCRGRMRTRRAAWTLPGWVQESFLVVKDVLGRVAWRPGRRPSSLPASATLVVPASRRAVKPGTPCLSTRSDSSVTSKISGNRRLGRFGSRPQIYTGSAPRADSTIDPRRGPRPRLGALSCVQQSGQPPPRMAGGGDACAWTLAPLLTRARPQEPEIVSADVISTTIFVATWDRSTATGCSARASPRPARSISR
jgi:hypothetical protein